MHMYICHLYAYNYIAHMIAFFLKPLSDVSVMFPKGIEGDPHVVYVCS